MCGRHPLFAEIVRVAGIIRPRAIVLENVAALYFRGLDRVLGALAEIGYDAEWHCVSADSVGAPHRRDRVFIVGYQSNSNNGLPSAHNAKEGGYPAEYRLNTPTLTAQVISRAVKEKKQPGTLNPEWVEWLMGFPSGWTNPKSHELQPESQNEPTGSDA